MKNRETGKHPVFIGPTFIHQDRKRTTYFYFASQLKKMRPGLDGLNAIGTDGEEALSSAFQSIFPSSVHLLCQIHKQDNITRKLRSLNVKELGMKQIISDIFGHRNGDSVFHGLVDATDSCDFGERLSQLEEKWNSISPGYLSGFLKLKLTECVHQ